MQIIEFSFEYVYKLDEHSISRIGRILKAFYDEKMGKNASSKLMIFI